MSYIPRRININNNYFNKENIVSNYNSNQSQNDDLKINLIPKNFNHTITKSAMSPLNKSGINNNE